MKLRALEAAWSARKWDAVIFTDIKYKDGGVRKINVRNSEWVMIQHGKVAFILNKALIEIWRAGGSKMRKGKGGSKARCLRVDLPSQGWNTGMSLIAVYAPTSAREHNELRRNLADEVLQSADSAPPDCKINLIKLNYPTIQV